MYKYLPLGWWILVSWFYNQKTMDIVSPIIDLLKEGWESVKMFHIVMEYEHGVRLRFGKFHSKIEAGLVWKWPIIDDILLVHNTITTMVVN